MGDLCGFVSVSVNPKHCSLDFKEDGYITLLNWWFNGVLFDGTHNEMSVRLCDSVAIVRVTSQVILCSTIALFLFSAPAHHQPLNEPPCSDESSCSS